MLTYGKMMMVKSITKNKKPKISTMNMKLKNKTRTQ